MTKEIRTRKIEGSIFEQMLEWAEKHTHKSFHSHIPIEFRLFSLCDTVTKNPQKKNFPKSTQRMRMTSKVYTCF